MQNDIDYIFSQSGAKANLTLLALLVFICLLSACDRPFVPPREPVITIISPRDPTSLRLSSNVEIEVSASSFRKISRIEVDNQPLALDSTTGNWHATVMLTPGINELDITAYDVEDFSGTRTLILAYVNPRYEQGAPSFPSPWRVAGHTATVLTDGSLLVTGGAPGESQEAVRQTFILPRDAEEMSALSSQLNNARFGHSAHLLPDGRVLILGGSTTAAATNVSQLVATSEIYDPATGEFTLVDFGDTPLLRMEHVAFVTTGPTSLIVDVYGGLGLDPVNDSDQLTVRGDILTFRLIGNTLSPLSNFEDSQIKPTFGMASTQLNEVNGTEMGRFIISGNNFFEPGSPNVNFSIDFNIAPIRVNILNGLTTRRTQHASAALEPGLVGLFGGFQGASSQSATGSTEIFVELGDQFFNIDNRVNGRRRFSHTATKLPSNRILILGGFSETGEAITEAEYFIWGE